MPKGFKQRKGIYYKETFSLVSKKDSLKIVLSLVTRYDLELHQMNVGTAFLNSDPKEEIYMFPPEGLVMHRKDLVCKLERSIYGLKQTSRQWYLKFHQVIIGCDFQENPTDCCIYQKFNESRFVILILYVDNLLPVTVHMLRDTKVFPLQKI